MKQEKKIAIPFETFVGICADVRTASDVAAFHLEYEAEKNPATTWQTTAVPVLCEYYVCLNALHTLLETTIFSEDSIVGSPDPSNGEIGSAIAVTGEDLETIQMLMEQAHIIKADLSSLGLSMEIH